MNLEDEMYRVMAALSAGDVPINFILLSTDITAKKRSANAERFFYRNQTRYGDLTARKQILMPELLQPAVMF